MSIKEEIYDIRFLDFPDKTLTVSHKCKLCFDVLMIYLSTQNKNTEQLTIKDFQLFLSEYTKWDKMYWEPEHIIKRNLHKNR